MTATKQKGMIDLRCGDALEVLRALPSDSIDSCVSDPPYELSNDGKASAGRVFLEFAFPKPANVEPGGSDECNLTFFVAEILRLCRVDGLPGSLPSVPIVPVALNGDCANRENDVDHEHVSAESVADSDTGPHVEAERAESLGCFYLKLADPSSMLDSLNGVGCGFVTGGLGVGFSVDAPGLPSLLHSSGAIECGDHDVRALDDSLAELVRAGRGAEQFTVARMSLGRAAHETLSAAPALMLLAALKLGGAQLVRAGAGASRLATKLQARRIRVVSPVTGRALAFDLIIQPVNISSTGFMGKAWDGSKVAFSVELWTEVLRVLKPGAHLLAFSAPRTYHRMTVAIEDAGFEIRDQVMWIFGSGFPKSLNVSKAIDKAGGNSPGDSAWQLRIARELRGLSRDDVAARVGCTASSVRDWEEGRARSQGAAVEHVMPSATYRKRLSEMFEEYPLPASRAVVRRSDGGFGGHAAEPGAYGFASSFNVTDHSTVGARKWDGWGTALKPAHEPITLARKPLAGTVAGNVLAFGCGAMNVGAARVDGDARPMRDATARVTESQFGAMGGSVAVGETSLGRWPANVMHDGSEEVLAAFPQSKDGIAGKRNANGSMFDMGSHDEWGGFGGGAARFFYTAKASRSERENGTDGLPERKRDETREDGAAGGNNPRNRGAKRVANHHPTVKPLALMRYLCRLVTPPGGTVLDPFMGSGTTGWAARIEGFSFVGIDREPEYVAIARARISGHAPLFDELEAEAESEPAQRDLFGGVTE